MERQLCLQAADETRVLVLLLRSSSSSSSPNLVTIFASAAEFRSTKYIYEENNYNADQVSLHPMASSATSEAAAEALIGLWSVGELRLEFQTVHRVYNKILPSFLVKSQLRVTLNCFPVNQNKLSTSTILVNPSYLFVFNFSQFSVKN